MQMRCKLPNEFAIRKPRLSCPAVPANFMNGPAWGMGGPPPRFPGAAPPATCRAARCRALARRPPVSCFGWGSEAAGQPAARRDHDTPPGPAGLRAPALLSRGLGRAPAAGGGEVSLQTSFPADEQPGGGVEAMTLGRGVNPGMVKSFP